MNSNFTIVRGRAVRRALLASTALAAFAQLPSVALADSTVKETKYELTRRSDTASFADFSLSVAEATNLLGFTPDVIAIGVDGGLGNDRLTLDGDANVSGSVIRLDDFGLISSAVDIINLLEGDSSTDVAVYGVDGGVGSNTLTLHQKLEVDAYVSAFQHDITPQGISGPDAYALGHAANASAVGLTSAGGRSRTTNYGELNVDSTAEYAQADVALDLIGVDLVSDLRQSHAVSIGLGGDRYTDYLTNALGGVVTAKATSNISATGISLQAVKLAGVSNATQSSATSAAMYGGDSNDVMSNDGALTATATSTLSENTIAVVAKELSLPGNWLPFEPENSFSLAVATGMDGGLGADRLTNNGDISLTSFADFNQFGLALSDGGISGDAIVAVIDHFSPDDDEEYLEEGAIAEIVGLRGDDRAELGGGADRLTNTGTITGVATADSDSTSISIGVPLSEVLTSDKVSGGAKAATVAHQALSVFGIGLLDYSSDAAAFADGVRGGAGYDVINNSGDIDVTANTTSNTVGVSVSALDALADSGAPDEPVSINSTVFNTAANAVSHSAGLAGGGENDTITNDGAVVNHANAHAGSAEVGVTFAMEDKALQIEAPVILSQTSATAQADGIDAGSGADAVVNNGSLESVADASASSTDVIVGVSIIETGGGINAAIVDKTISADAVATGIRDGLGADTVNNAGSINATATSAATSTSVAVEAVVNTTTGLSLTSGLAKADQDSTAHAFGVERILDDQDVDASFTSTGDIDATATATSTRNSISVDLAYVNTGASIAAPIIYADNKAQADAGALLSFEADDVFSGLADMTATANATSITNGVGVSGAVSQVGVGAGVSVLKSSTISTADATLLSFGLGADTVLNGAVLLADANAVSQSANVAVGVGGTNKGLGVGAALADSFNKATAYATTVNTGGDNDVVVNDRSAIDGVVSDGDYGVLSADAFADAHSTGVDVGLSAVVGTQVNPGVGVGLSAALARAGVNGVADATAVNLGAGDDSFLNADEVSAVSTGKARNETVAVALGGSMVGGAVSGALADTSVDADSYATGAEGGAGADTLSTAGVLSSNATADANTVGVNVSGSIAMGFAAGAAGLLTDTTADAEALGMNGGAGEDTLENSGTTTIDADADAANTTVAVNVNATPTGLSVGAAIVSASTTAHSDAVGLSGDADGLKEDDEPTLLASENDTVKNLGGSLTVTARAEATTTSVGVNGQYNGFGGVAIIADTISDANAVGLFGGSGADELYNAADITTISNAYGDGPAVAVNPFGANIGDVFTKASAFSYGLDGGVGDDNLFNVGSISSTANADVSSDLVQVTLIGAAVGDLSTKANATAAGMFGGAGGDYLSSTGALTSTATANVTGVSVAVDFIGASFADIVTQATAIASGMSGGDGDNSFDLGGAVNAAATADARSTNVSVTLAGAAFADSADASTLGVARSYGYLGGSGADSGLLSGAVTVASTAYVKNESAAADIAGASFAKTAPEARATASAFSGGGGADNVVNSGSSSITADADGVVGGTAVSLIGASSVTTDPLANATALGLGGDAGADSLANSGSLTTLADAYMNVARIRVTLAGASIGSISSASEAIAAGLDGGADDDTLTNTGALHSTAKSKLDSHGVDVTLFGSNVDTAEGDQLAKANAYGLRGGDGDDYLGNANSIVSTSTVTGSSVQVNVLLAGAGLADAQSRLEAYSVGLDGEAGDDELLNTGVVTSVATVGSGNVNTTVTLAGAAGGDTSARTLAQSSILEGGAGDDILTNYGVGVSTATAVGAAYNVEVTVAGALLGAAESNAEAAANGLGGGAGDDSIYNGGRLDLNGTATGSVGRTSVAVAGSDGGASLETDVKASAVGVSGGAGADDAVNNDEIDIDLSSSTSANAASRVIAGNSRINAGLYSTVNGVGMDGGDADDHFVNDVDGDINIAANASINASNSSFNIAGVSATNGLMRSRGYGVGMAGGAGDDMLYNYGSIHLDINGVASASGSNFTLAGAALSGGDVRGTTNIYGMAGGAGDDLLYNDGTIYARSDARGTFGAGAYSFAGYAATGGAVGATATTTGLFGDLGFDELYIGGTVTSIADARLTMNNDVNATFGSSSTSRSAIEADAYGRGANGGVGDDVITVTGALATYGYASLSMSNTKFAGVGAASGSNSATTRSEAFGLIGDDGDDILTNEGDLTVITESKTIGSGSAGAAIGSTSSAAEIVARANAIGLYGGDGLDMLINAGTITAEVTNSTKAVNTVASYALFSSGEARSTSTNYGYGSLFYDAVGDTTVVNDGDASLIYHGDRGDYRGIARAEATANGVTYGGGTNARAYSKAYSTVALRGVYLGGGEHSVVNNGSLEVKSYAFSSATATGNGNAAISGFGTADARAYANSNTVSGVESLSGALDFVNTGTISVLNNPRGSTHAEANATGISLSADPDAVAYARIELNNVKAYGVRSGSEDDYIENSGTISARSQPEANRAWAHSKSGGGFNFSVDAFTDAYAYADYAEAYGVYSGDGDDTVINNGVITAVSDPYAKASADSYGHGRDGDAESLARAYARYATAYGIVTAGGDDTIVNNGMITVSSTPSATATTTASRGSYCYISTPAVVVLGVTIVPAITVCEYGEIDQNSKASYTTGATVVGISSGGGDDVVTNAGKINASGGTAISLGDGDDTLIIAEGSSITGSVSAGAGNDTLHFVGAHSWNASGQSFENFIKSGAGITTLSNPGTLVGQTAVYEGVLNISGGVTMSAASQLTTSVFADGRVGQLASTGVINANGVLDVVANYGAYVDGRNYKVVAGTGTPDIVIILVPGIPGLYPDVTTTIFGTHGLQGGFDTVSLPDATALRSFTGSSRRDDYTVTVHVDDIASLMGASNATAQSFAEALDDATPTATGGVEETIAMLQSLPEADQVVTAVEDLSPEISMSAVELTSATLDASDTATDQRLASFRAGKFNQTAPTAFGFAFSQGARSPKGATSWTANFNDASASSTFAKGYSGFVSGMAHGLDVETESGALFGMSMTNLQGNGSVDRISTTSAFTSTTASIYGAAPLGKSSYASASFSWSNMNATGGDPLYGANPDYDGMSEKRSTAMRVNFEAGKLLRAAPGAPELFAAMSYRHAQGQAFALDRVSALSLDVEHGRTEQLESEIGLRLAKSYNIEGINLRPHLSLSWVKRYGEGESVSASFADMPGYQFRLLAEHDNADALRLNAGFSLLAGDRYELTAYGASEFGAVENDARGGLRAVMKF